MSERQGIEIDYCPECRGVWLDRGELDKILERAQAESEAAGFQAPQPPAPQVPPQQPRYDDRRDDRRYNDRGHHDRGYGARDDRGYGSKQGNYRKKKSPFEFLGDIFEG